MILIRCHVEMTSSCAAPLCARPSLASINCSDCSVSLVYKRSRRRGPRNFLAKMRRALPKRCRALPGMASGESEVSMPVFFNDFPYHNSRHNSNLINSAGPSTQLISSDARKPGTGKKKEEISIFMVNIRCLSANLAELECHLHQLQPHIVFIQETWLDASTESVSITNYTIISRRDRSQN